MTSKAFIVKFRLPLLISLLALILFFSLRLVTLTRIPVFVDEAIYIRWSQIMRNEPSLRFLPLSDGKQPLFMWATMPALKFISDPLVAGRIVSLFAGLISLIGLSLLTFTLTASWPIASFAALIYAILPFTVFFDRLALADSLLAAFGVWSLVLGSWLIKKPRLDLAMILGFAIGFGLLTKTPAVFFYLWQPILFLFLHPPLRLRGLIKLLFYWTISIVISQGIYNILRLGPNFHLIGSRNQDYVFSLAEVLTHPTNPLIGNLKTSFSWLWFLFTPPLFLVGLFSLAGKFKKTAILLLLLSLFPLFSQGLIAKVYTSRYILFAVLPLVVPISLGLWEVGERLRKHWLFLFIFLLWPVILSAVLVDRPQKANLPYDMRSGYLEEWTAGAGQTEIAAYLIDRSKQGEKAVVVTDGFFGTLPDGLQIYTAKYPTITVIGGSPSITALPQSLTDSLLDPKNTVYLVANASRVKLPPAELARLDLISQYPKPTRSDGTHETLLFFRLIR
jgi:4-amino-4-deoxy-L-arabinose transferase-like glycosyltransferase